MPLGVRSRLVLEKLGFELRRLYDDLLSAPFPRSIRKRLDRLPETRDVVKLRGDGQGDGGAPPT